MPQCCVLGCTTRSGQQENCEVKYVLHSFPKDPHFSDVWVVRSGRKDRVFVKKSRICEKHFSSDQYHRNFFSEFGLVGKDRHRRGMLREDAVPDQALPNGKHNAATNAENSVRREERMAEKERKRTVVALLEETGIQPAPPCKRQCTDSSKFTPLSSGWDTVSLLLEDSLQFMESQSTQIKEEAFPGESCSLPLEMVVDEGPGTCNASSPTSLATVKTEPFIEMVEVKEEKCEHEEEDLEIKQEQFHWWGSNLECSGLSHVNMPTV